VQIVQTADSPATPNKEEKEASDVRRAGHAESVYPQAFTSCDWMEGWSDSADLVAGCCGGFAISAP